MADIEVEQFTDDIEIEDNEQEFAAVEADIEQAEVKMFNKWSVESVKVDDLSLDVSVFPLHGRSQHQCVRVCLCLCLCVLVH